MNKTKMTYFEKEDILHLAISDDPESDSLELSPNITAELNGNGELIGIEILNATTFIRDSILRIRPRKNAITHQSLNETTCCLHFI